MSNIEDAANREIAGLEAELASAHTALATRITDANSREALLLERLRDLMAHVQACTTCGGQGTTGAAMGGTYDCAGCGGFGERMGPAAAPLFPQVRDLIKLYDETEKKAGG